MRYWQAIRRTGWLVIALLGAVLQTSAAQQAGSGDPLRPGDVLRLRIFQEPEMSGEFPLDERGSVTLPRLGTIAVSSWPADSIRPRLTRAFGEFLRDPVVEVTVLRRISVTGSVLKPGLYPVDPSMTVSDALALAGGASPDGRRDRVELRRGTTRSLASLDRASIIADLRLRSGDQLFVPQRSWLSRNTWLVSTLIGATATVTTIVLTR
ncbi:MAG: polysaccharide biosynthesis/export family protein [Gemmatimonadales bacterium]